MKNAIVLSFQGMPCSVLGPYGNEWIATPNLDRLAVRSLVCDQHFAWEPTVAGARYAYRTARPPWSPAAQDPQATSWDLLEACRQAGRHTRLLALLRPQNPLPEAFTTGWDSVVPIEPLPTDRTPMAALIRTLREMPPLPDTGWLLWIEWDGFLPPWDIPLDVFQVYAGLDDDENDENEVNQADKANDENAEEYANDEENDEENDEDTRFIPAEAAEVSRDAEIAELPAEEPALPAEPWRHPPTGWFDTSDDDSLSYLQASVAAAVTTIDADLEKLFAYFTAQGWERTALWLVVSDYGFPLGEHGQLGPHRPWPYEELVHVPWLLARPMADSEGSGGTPDLGRRLNCFTTPADLPAVLACHLELVRPPAWPTTLWDRWLSPTTADPSQTTVPDPAEPLRESLISHAAWGGQEFWAVRTADWTLIRPLTTAPSYDRDNPIDQYDTDDTVDEPEAKSPTLFQRPDDRWEVNDLYARNLGFADELEAILTAQGLLRKH